MAETIKGIPSPRNTPQAASIPPAWWKNWPPKPESKLKIAYTGRPPKRKTKPENNRTNEFQTVCLVLKPFFPV